MRRFEPHIIGTLGGVLLCVALLVNPLGYDHLIPGGDTLVSATVRVIAWLIAALACICGLALIRWRRSISATNLLLLCLTCFTCFIVIEFALGILGVQPSRRLVVRVPPQMDWWTVDSERGGRISPDKYSARWPINAQGFADTDAFVATTFDENLKRVLLLGDSFAFGVKASKFKNAFSQRMESKGDVLVWNTGLPGTGQRRQLKSLQTHFPTMKPDIVVVAFSMNDFGDNRFPLGQYYVFEGQKWVHRYQRQADGSMKTLDPEAAFRRAYQARNFQERIKSSRLVTCIAQAIARPAPPPQRGDMSIGAQPGTTETKELLASIRDYVHKRGSRILVMLVPRRGELTSPGRAYQAAQRLCEELRIDVLDLRDLLTITDYVTTPDGHWNDAGHAKVAQKLREVVLSYR